MKHCDNFSPLRMDLEASTSVIQKVKVSDLTKKVLALCRKFRLETFVNLKSREFFGLMV